ncbi:hypothetical protein QAD02_019999 [Eretmocerus hayati]|uniref:Uncharacterized protein n=1 Tax=Eretmocerus hayati TaxID=131215 RepID=A0ACC2PPD6_9HYME|nr:hypothetical protein QAD02_019999 [Eretmocerus hayati]
MRTRRTDFSLPEDRSDAESVSYFVPIQSPSSNAAPGFRGFSDERIGEPVNNLALHRDVVGDLMAPPNVTAMANMRTARATGEMLPDDAANAAVAGDRGPVGGVNATDGEATSSDNAEFINAASRSAEIVAAGVDDAASRDATTGNAIDDAAIGCAASRAAASYDAALGNASLGGVALHQDTSIGAANDVVLGLGVCSVSRGIRHVDAEPVHDLEVQHLADELRHCSRDLIAERQDCEERHRIWAEDRRLLQDQVQHYKQLSQLSIANIPQNTTNAPSHYTINRGYYVLLIIHDQDEIIE